MIYYDGASWFGLVFRYRGTVWERIWHLTLAVVIGCLALYYFGDSISISPGGEGHTILGSTMSYLLVFRANAAAERYWAGRTIFTQTFTQLRHLIMVMCVAMKGGAASEAWQKERDPGRAEKMDANDIKASMARVNCVRLVLAYVVSIKLFTRIAATGFTQGIIDGEMKRRVDIDRIRLRGLMTRQEFEHVDSMIPIFHDAHTTVGAGMVTSETIEQALQQPVADVYEVDTVPDMKQALAILMLMRIEIVKHMNEPYGIKDRVAKEMMTICDHLSTIFEHLATMMTTPIPLPYVHLCKVMLSAYLLMLPLVQNPSKGFYSSVCIPGCLAMSLLGIDAIAVELADPFGGDTNDLDVMGLISQLEDECIHFLDLCGDSLALQAFRSYEIMEDLNDDCRNPTEFMCLVSQVDVDAAPDDEDVESGHPSQSVVFLPVREPLFSIRRWKDKLLTGSLRMSLSSREKDLRRQSSKQRLAGVSAGKKPSKEPPPPPPECFEEGDPREPLLAAEEGSEEADSPVGYFSQSSQAKASAMFRSMGEHASSSVAGFVPMNEIDSDPETLVFTEGDDDDGRDNADCVGLSDDEDGASKVSGSKVFSPMPSNLASSLKSRSPRNSKAREDRKKRRSKIAEGGVSPSSSGQLRPQKSSDAFFRPMDEMGTQTVHFSEGDDDSQQAGPDVIGLSDDEGEDEAASSRRATE